MSTTDTAADVFSCQVMRACIHPHHLTRLENLPGAPQPAGTDVSQGKCPPGAEAMVKALPGR